MPRSDAAGEVPGRSAAGGPAGVKEPFQRGDFLYFPLYIGEFRCEQKPKRPVDRKDLGDRGPLPGRATVKGLDPGQQPLTSPLQGEDRLEVSPVQE